MEKLKPFKGTGLPKWILREKRPSAVFYFNQCLCNHHVKDVKNFVAILYDFTLLK